MKSIALVSSQLRRRFANFVITRSSSDTSSFEQHAIERVRYAIPYKRVSSGPREDSRLIVRCIRYSSTRAWHGTSMQDVILERERTDDGIVLHFVVHLVSILDVDSGASDVVEHVFFNGRRMGAVDDNSPLMASLDGIVLE